MAARTPGQLTFGWKGNHNMPEGSTELQDIINDAASPFIDEDLPTDSAEDVEDPEEDLEDEEVDVEDEADEDLEDDEDPDEDSDEEDQDNLEDDEDESDEDDEEDEEEDSEDLHEVKVSGETLKVPLEELKAGYQRQADYTQKLQRVHDVYRKMEEWYEARSGNPAAWVAEIAYQQDDPAGVIAEAIEATGDASILYTQATKALVEKGALAEELVEAMNLKHLAEQAKEQSVHHEVQSLRNELQQFRSQEEEQRTYAEVEAELERQWQSVLTKNGLEFESPDQEYSEKVKVLTFASENGIPNLEIAHAAMTALDGKAAAPKTVKAKKQAEKVVRDRKRKTAAMSRKPTGGGGRPKQGKKLSGEAHLQNAAAEALAELGLDA